MKLFLPLLPFKGMKQLISPETSGCAASDRSSEARPELADTLFQKADNALDFVKTAYEFIRDNISHSAEINNDVITCTASEVLKAGHGIYFAKFHLLAALLRCKSIPTGFCYQKLLSDDDTSPVLMLIFDKVTQKYYNR